MVHLHAPRYVLGEIEMDHTAIPGLHERAEALRMAPSPALWGWGSVFRTEHGIDELAIDSAAATLAAAGAAPSTVDALVLCSTDLPVPPREHGRFLAGILNGIGLGDVAAYGLGLNRCGSLLAGLDVASALVAGGRYRRILVVTTDRMTDEAERMAHYALFSDGAASCLVTADGEARDRYELVACASAHETASLDWAAEISSDLARRVNDALLSPLELGVGDVAGLMHLNIFKPLVVMKERQAGFRLDQLHIDNIPRVGHCFSADPLINLVDRAAAGRVRAGGLYLLASSVPGSRQGVLLRRLGD
jgi:3-oxoacyl-[acyl-carrier-protein] synthase III